MHKPRQSRPKKAEPPQPEILPPGAEPSDPLPPAVYAAIAAQINQYTDRPDLLIETIERHDPGFIKAMNEEAREFSKRSRDERFRFGRTQAYAALSVQVAAAAAVLYVLYIAAEQKQLSFWTLAGFGILFAITQSGPSGFVKVVDQIAKICGVSPKK